MPLFKKMKGAPKKKKEVEISQLSYQYMMYISRQRGICLIINNVPNLVAGEKQLEDLFKFLSFDVLIKRGLQRDEIYTLAEEFAKKDHTLYDTFVVIFMSVSGLCSEISGADGRNASLEDVMMEFTASRSPTLRGKPKLFFVQCFQGIFSRVKDKRRGGSFADKDIVELPYISTSKKDNCPEEADFMLICVTSTYPADQPNGEPGSLFIQILDQVIRSSYHQYHLLDMLTMVNKQMMDIQKDRPNNREPHRNQTLRAKVYLSRTPPSGFIPRAFFLSYEMNKHPRGLCVIVNNVKFDDKKLNRPGAVQDELSLKHLFRGLTFRVIIRRNLTSHKMEKVARKFGAANHVAYNAFVFIVMSHGEDRDCILGKDGRETTVKNLMFEFVKNKCPSLRDKPKVFIIQTCRGGRYDAVSSVSSPANDSNSLVVATTSQAQISSQPCGTAFSTDSTLPRSVFPPEADFVLAFATAPGYVSHRNRRHGTWFIQALVEVITKYHHRHHLLEILTEVTRLVVELHNSVQVPAPMDTLTKFLYM